MGTDSKYKLLYNGDLPGFAKRRKIKITDAKKSVTVIETATNCCNKYPNSE